MSSTGLVLYMLGVLGMACYAIPETIEIAPGVEMPRINLGTCCGSKPQAGLPGWLNAGGVGIDTAWDYKDQPDIATFLKSSKIARSDVFITTKVPAGIGAISNVSDCAADPEIALWYVRDNLAQLGVDYVDLVLLHGPCELNPAIKDPTAANNALWKGLQAALETNVTRAIGVSNYKPDMLQKLAGPKPSVNQCEMSVLGSFGQKGHDDEGIAYCQQHGIAYEAYGVLKGCPKTDQRVQSMAVAHNVSVTQICLRWVIQRGAILATGTGNNTERAAEYARSDLNVFHFELTNEEIDTLNKMQDEL